MSRQDITDKLIHFTQGANDEAAYQRLRKIVDEMGLVGSAHLIKGGSPCVCFTEAPLDALPGGLVNPDRFSRYAPFGLLFEKSWVFAHGGRPVIYQSDAEFELLPEALRWRHVQYEPGVIDFTWEREWRVQCDALKFTPKEVAIVVPTEAWAHRLIDEHGADQDLEVEMYSMVMDHQFAGLEREAFAWTVIALGM
jgi:hypothetical protein